MSHDAFWALVTAGAAVGSIVLMGIVNFLVYRKAKDDR